MDADGATKVSDVEKLEQELQRISSGAFLTRLRDQPIIYTQAWPEMFVQALWVSYAVPFCEKALQALGIAPGSSCLQVAGSRSEAAGMVVGSRAHLEEEAIAKRHWIRNFLMRGFHLLVLLVAGGAVRDTQCGFKVCPASECPGGILLM